MGVERLADGEASAGELTEIAQAEFGITQPAVSRHLRVLRENGFAEVRADGTRRLYAVRTGPLQEVDRWIERYRGFWTNRLRMGRVVSHGAEDTACRAPARGARRKTPGHVPRYDREQTTSA